MIGFRSVRLLLLILSATTLLVPHAWAQAVYQEPLNPAPLKATTVSHAEDRLIGLNNQLATLSPHIFIESGQQRLDTATARAAGFEAELIELAAQIVTYQNMVRTNPKADPNLEKFPQLATLFDDATTAAAQRLRTPTTRRGLDVTTVHPCGDLTHPVPATNPPRVLVGPQPQAVEQLLASGFHPTAGYVCGAPAGKPCGYDYTRGRDYAGPYGVCPAPALRDQATLSSAHSTQEGEAYWLQEGEPNPELKEYDWPYWNWGSYVTWWHDHY